MANTSPASLAPAARPATSGEAESNAPVNRRRYWLLLVITYVCLFVGSVASSLLSKFYFIHKGKSRWVSTWVQSAGFPLLLLLIYLPFYLFNNNTNGTRTRRPFLGLTRNLFLLSAVIGFLLGLTNFLFSWGTSYLPVSTSSLLLSTELAFTLILSVIVVRQTVTFDNLTCVILLTLGSILLVFGPEEHNKTDQGSSRGKYVVGVLSTLGTSLLFALYLPLMELINRHVTCYSMAMEMQLIIQIAATVFASAGMAASGGFGEMEREAAKLFDLGDGVYWCTLWATVVAWQLFFIGTAGTVFLTTSLTGGVCMGALVTAKVIGGVVAYGDHFGGLKAVSTVLCVWGVCCYAYGIYVRGKKEEEEEEEGRRSAGVDRGQSDHHV